MEEYSPTTFNDAPVIAAKAGGAILVAVAVVLLAYFSIRGPREVVAVLPYPDGGKAAVLMNHGGGEMLMLVGGDGKVAWSADLPLFRPDMVRAGASVGGPAITVRGFAHLDAKADDKILDSQRTVRTWAYSVTDGTPLWEGADSGLPMKAAVAPPYVSNLADDTGLYEIHITRPHSVVGVDRATGKETMRVAIPEEWSDVDAIVRAWLRPNYVIIDQPATFVFVDRKTSKINKIRVREWPCVTEDAVFYEPEDDTAMIRRSLTDLSDTPLFELQGNLLGACGTRNGATIFGVESEFKGNLLAIDAAGKPAWTIDLGGWSMDAPNERDVRTSYAEQMPLQGALPRFVPMLVVDWDPASTAPARHGLVVLDLDSRKVAWTAEDPAIGEWQVVRDSGNFYLFRGNAVIRIDGETGQPAGAVKLEGADAFRPYQFAGGKLWAFGPRVVRVLDLATMKLDSGGWGWGPLEAKDYSADAKKLLAPD